MSTPWSSGAFVVRDVPVPDGPTEFEQLVFRLGLEHRPDLWQFNGKIRQFVRTHRHRRYVPESLLRELGFVCSEEEAA